MLQLPPLFPYQAAVMESTVIELVLLGVVQMGKTFVLAAWLNGQAWTKPRSLNWWAAPTYSQAEVGYKAMRGMLEPSGALARAADSRLRLDLVNGSRIECRSWERDENLLGPSVDGGIVADQAELLTGRARAILSSRRAASLAPMRFGGNAGVFGQEFHKLCRQAEAEQASGSSRMGFVRWTWRDRLAALEGKERSDYETFIENEQKNLPADEFLRLYGSEFLTLGTGVLDFLPIAVNGGDQLHPVALPFFESWSGNSCVAGLDLGDQQDFSVLSIVDDTTGRLVAMDRFNRMPWEAQVERVVGVAKRYCRRPDKEKRDPGQTLAIYVDATMMGAPIYQMLDKAAVELPIEVIPVTFDNAKKRQMVQYLQAAAQGRWISMPYIAEAIEEAQMLERVPLQNGVTYRAAGGAHDDIVFSLGLMGYGRMRQVQVAA